MLGIGGVRALRALDLHPQVFHTNEGHAGFLGLERVREWTEQGLSFTEAVEAVRAGGVFTTHTPVPAGIDRFPRELFEQYFTSFAEACGVDVRRRVRAGHTRRRTGRQVQHGGDGPALGRPVERGRPPPWRRVAADVRRHVAGTACRQRPDRPRHERCPRPQLGQQPCRRDVHRDAGEDWHLASAEDWKPVHQLDRSVIWDIRNTGRLELVGMVRDLLGHDLLDPDVLTIGFARRFATYKRSTLLLSQLDRLKKMLLDPERPVQFVFAGKAHPADQPGKALIQEIHHLASEHDVRHRFVFIPDYDIGIARTMYHGCDVWLNTPRRPMEACGTSGMKAALNGVLNCSILDGWWDEMTDGTNGFDIPSFDHDDDEKRRDHREANATFDVIENRIVPMYYDRGDDGIPHRWLEYVANNWATLGWNVSASRMVRDYVTDLYEPAAASARAGRPRAGRALVNSPTGSRASRRGGPPCASGW